MSELVIYWRELWIVKGDKKLHYWMTEGKGGSFEKKRKKENVCIFNARNSALSGWCSQRPMDSTATAKISSFCSFNNLVILQFKMYFLLIFILSVPLLPFTIAVIHFSSSFYELFFILPYVPVQLNLFSCNLSTNHRMHDRVLSWLLYQGCYMCQLNTDGHTNVTALRVTSLSAALKIFRTAEEGHTSQNTRTQVRWLNKASSILSFSSVPHSRLPWTSHWQHKMQR